MKKLFFLCLTVCLGMWASAQKVYFLYLQSDDQSPFYVRMGDKIHSSAASGFLIISNLKDSTYNFGLGFAKSSEPESSFSVNISQNDKGYIIKKFEEGLALFDFRDLSILKANAAHKDNTVYQTKSDKFSSTLSKAASDPSILKVPVAKKEEPAKPVEKEKVVVKLEEAKQVEKTAVESTGSQPKAEAQTQVAEATTQIPETDKSDKSSAPSVTADAKPDAQPAVNLEKKEVVPTVEANPKKEEAAPATYKPSTILRYSESSTTEGFGLVYFDKKEDGVDTIRILIPASKVKLVSEDNGTTGNEEAKAEKDEPAASNKQSKTETNAANREKEKVPAVTDQPAKTEVAKASACKSIAADKDFMKLRKKMAAEENEDDMLDEARKEFRSRCYSVEQLRYLSTLFLTSASRYQFFDAAYPYVTDKVNFASLGAEIKDEHYAKRFKALIGE